MKIAFIRHQPHGKLFLFELDIPLYREVKKGDSVLCDTRYGEKIGIVEEVVGIASKDYCDVIVEACGATLPLKKVLRKYVKPIVTRIEEIPERFIAQIRNEERAKIIREINGVQDALPFDSFGM